MRIWGRRMLAQLRRRSVGRKRRGRHPLWLGGLVGIGTALALIWGMELRLRPVLDVMATAKVENTVTLILDGVIAEEIAERGLNYNDLITMERDSSGRITALTSDMAALNGLRTRILGAVTKAVDDLKPSDLSIPVGNLTGIHILSGRGFSLPVEVVSVGAAHAEFQDQFTEAGINQTRHQILLEVTVNLDILLPGETLNTQITAQVPVAETVIVGQVPQVYLSAQGDILP